MELIKLSTEGQPLVEALDNDKVVVAQQNGMVTVVYFNSNKILSVELKAEAVQIELYNQSVYISTKPFAIQITKDNEESEEVLTNNLLASKKTGSTLWKLDIQDESLVINNTFTNVGGFAIKDDKLYACNISSYGFYVLSLNLMEIELVPVQIEPSTRRPWYSNITIVDNILYLTQEEERIRWFELGDKIEEKGIVGSEFIHQTSFFSLNAAPKKMLRIKNYILGILTSGEPFVISFIDQKPIVAVDPKTIFTLNYKEKSAVLNRVQTATDQYVLAMDRYRIIITDAAMSTALHGFCLDEVDETLNLTRIALFGNYAVCFAWTYAKKYPLIVMDLTNPQDPVIVQIIDCGVTSGAIKIDLDE